jgi:hypothetical protein
MANSAMRWNKLLPQGSTPLAQKARESGLFLASIFIPKEPATKEM